MYYKDNLKRLNEINFWRAEYIKRKAQKDLGLDAVLEFRKYIDTLKCIQDPELNDDVVRYTLNAIHNEQMGISPSYKKYKFLNSETTATYHYMYKLSLEYGYCFDTLVEEPLDGFQLIKYIEKEKSVPNPPPIFPSKRNPYLHIFIAFIGMELNQYEYYPVGDKEESMVSDNKAYQIHKNTVAKSEEEYNNNENDISNEILYKKFFSYIKHNFKDRDAHKSTWSEKNKNDFIETCKKIYPVKFHTDSSVTRAYGLYLWDNQFYNKSCSTAKAIKKIQKHIDSDDHEVIENSEQNRTNDAIRASEEEGINITSIETSLREKLANTIKCIEAGAVLSI